MHRILLPLILALGLTGCGGLDKLMGSGMDNTVLPGQREEAIPGRSQFPDPSEPKPGEAAPAETVSSEPAPPAESGSECPPDDPNCAPASDDTFSDPQ